MTAAAPLERIVFVGAALSEIAAAGLAPGFVPEALLFLIPVELRRLVSARSSPRALTRLAARTRADA